MINLPILDTTIEDKQFNWKLEADHAELINTITKRPIWSGSLLPSFEIKHNNGNIHYVHPKVNHVTNVSSSLFLISLHMEGFGSGELTVGLETWGIRISEMNINWDVETSIISLTFGARLMNDSEQQRAPRLDKPIWPTWSSEGYCIPCAGSSPTSSYWRSWDMGDSLLPLGSFGDAMGTPYAAAFPRPLYAASMGGPAGWICFGPGEIPDAPLSLKLQASTACLQYLYREDLWQPADTLHRKWREPLRMAWGNTGYDAYDALFQSFPAAAAKSPHHLRSFVCTWGDFKENRYDLLHYTDRISATTPAEMVVLDDHWESYGSSGKHNDRLFPDFEEDIKYMKEKGFEVAFWQSLAWLDKPEDFGLNAEDLLCGIDGNPRLWAWSGNPLMARKTYHYCLDPSSAKTRRFLIERTQNIVNRWKPVALKLDFGYGVPGPDVCAPRNPEFRGERLTAELLKIIRTAAKEIDPEITIIYYGIHPLLHEYMDMINLDDLGDAGSSAYYEIIGHNQRCMWAALAARHGMAINTSTGYFWDTLEPILLNTAVVGVNGLTLGEFDSNGNSWKLSQINRWHALNHWHRRTCGWTPLWLDADMGGIGSEPSITSWGRIEGLEGKAAITALAIRNQSDGIKRFPQVENVHFTGEWALISQDDQDISDSVRLACIPFKAGILTLTRPFAAIEVYKLVDHQLQCVKTITQAELPSISLQVSEQELSEIVGFIILNP